jgi:hypothetical protein
MPAWASAVITDDVDVDPVVPQPAWVPARPARHARRVIWMGADAFMARGILADGRCAGSKWSIPCRRWFRVSNGRMIGGRDPIGK